MHVKIKVKDLSLNQWRWLEANLPVNREFEPGDIRVCVELEASPMMTFSHVEMPVREFLDLLNTLAQLETAQAVLRPDELPDHLHKVRQQADPALPDTEAGQDPLPAEPRCDHGATVTRETPPVFEGASPVREYGDGCQSYGPYR